MIRWSSTRADCTTCGARMAAVRGPFSQNIGRPKPPAGDRLGYVIEQPGKEIPICAECLALILTVKESH